VNWAGGTPLTRISPASGQRQHFDNRRFARAVAAEEPVNAAAPHPQAQVLHRRILPERAGDVFGFDHVCIHKTVVFMGVFIGDFFSFPQTVV
jgi:hypothetical protein